MDSEEEWGNTIEIKEKNTLKRREMKKEIFEEGKSNKKGKTLCRMQTNNNEIKLNILTKFWEILRKLKSRQ